MRLFTEIICMILIESIVNILHLGYLKAIGNDKAEACSQRKR